MKRIRKYLLAGGLAVLALVAVGSVLILGSRWLTSSDAVRKKLTAETARLTGGTLAYEKLALHLLPLPHLTAVQVDYRIPGKVALQTASLAVYPDVPSLMGGKFVLDGVVIVHPSIRIKTPPSKVASASRKPSAEMFRKALAGLFKAAARLGPDLSMKMKGGSVVFDRRGRPPVTVENIHLKVKSQGQVVTLALRCNNTVIGAAALNGKLDLKTRRSDGRLRLDGLNARPLMAGLPVPGGIALSDTRLKLNVTFQTRNDDKAEAAIVCKVPEVRIERQSRSLLLRDAMLVGDLQVDPEKLTWDISALQVESHGLDLASAGTLAFDGRIKPAALDLEAVGRRIDVAAVARGFNALAGDQAWVPAAFNVAREGRLSRATCRLTLRRTEDGWRMPLLRATGRLDNGLISIPGADLDLKDVSGDVALENQRVAFFNMEGRLPYGNFKSLATRIDWQNDATLAIDTPRAVIDLTEFYPWLTAFEGLKRVQKFVSTADGNLNLTTLEISGPLTDPAAWRLVVAAGIEDVLIESPELNGPLRLKEGRVHFKPKTLALEEIRLAYLDTAADTSCRILGKPGQPEELELSMDGTFGERSLVWMRRFLTLPEHLRVQPPLKVAGMKLQWNDRSHVAVKGEITSAVGTRAFADIVFTPARWKIKRFELNDGISDFSLQLEKTDRRIDLNFAGKVQKTTLDHILRENQILNGWVAGKLKASLDMQQPQASVADGALQGEGLVMRRLAAAPIELARFAINCDGKSARVESADLVIAETPLHLTGHAGITAEAYTFDLDLAAESLDAAVLEKLRPAQSAASEEKPRPREPLPLSGVIRFKTPRFNYKNYTWTPLHADIRVQPDTIQVTATEANLCGIATPGTVTIDAKEGMIDLAFAPKANAQDLQATWECLQPNPFKADSRYNLHGNVRAHGTADDILKNLAGDFTFFSADGLIHRSNILVRIFAILNVTEVFAGKTVGLREKGTGYDAALARGTIRGGNLLFDEILFDAHTMKISGVGAVNLLDETLDLTLLVAPLKTLDRIVRKVPVVGYITGGSILSAPVRVKGRMSNPEVVPLPPAAVGRGIVGILERTLKAPLKVVESLPKGQQEAVESGAAGP